MNVTRVGWQSKEVRRVINQCILYNHHLSWLNLMMILIMWMNLDTWVLWNWNVVSFYLHTFDIFNHHWKREFDLPEDILFDVIISHELHSNGLHFNWSSQNRILSFQKKDKSRFLAYFERRWNFLCSYPSWIISQCITYSLS